MFITQRFLFDIESGLMFLVGNPPTLWRSETSMLINASASSNSFIPLVQEERKASDRDVYRGDGIGFAVIAISLEKLIDITGLEIE